ncbi:MAG: aldehyde ferredoxin oxidoreductase C-terminal domain-containing protein [Thiolinea sp.]
MRDSIDIRLDTQDIQRRTLSGQELTSAGRHLIARMLLEQDIATIDPLSDQNPLIFSAGPFAGTNFSNGNRLSIGCKSPLTGGIKEANSGGTFAFAMGQLQIATMTLHGAADDWVVIRITKDGDISFEDASPYMGLGNFDCAKRLHEKYGEKISLALCGPVGEYQGLMAGIAFSDTDNRPSRLAARGGVGAVMGVKKVKAIVIDKLKMPPMHDRKKVMTSVREYGKKLDEAPVIQVLKTTGTAMVGDITNYMGAMPVRNFSAGQLVDRDQETFKLGGDYIRELNTERGGDTSHACMPGCLIKCSNVYVDDTGRELVSPLEYETLGLLGSNCGLTDPDDVARLNETANDLGIDSIELGATLGVLMEAGEGEFGDVAFMQQCIDKLFKPDERGRLIADGTAAVGEALNVQRIPVIKKQAISAYDPRLIEVTGISMMFTAQGADHTVGNAPTFPCDGEDVSTLVAESYKMQLNSAVADSLGLCVFGRTVTDPNLQLIADAINGAFGTEVDPEFIRNIGAETLRLEKEFNRLAGFTEADDELPAFFHAESLPPSGKTARLTSQEVNQHMATML